MRGRQRSDDKSAFAKNVFLNVLIRQKKYEEIKLGQAEMQTLENSSEVLKYARHLWPSSGCIKPYCTGGV